MRITRLRRFSKPEVNWAGVVLRKETAPAKEVIRALEVVIDWRSAHQPLIARFVPALTARAKKVDSSSLIGTRLKRVPTMLDKLVRLPRLKLWTMQDVGGLRAIVNTPEAARALADDLAINPPALFELRKRKDYIDAPKESGYRGIHLVYAYVGEGENDDEPELQGLTIEVQIRTRLEHTWATSVEIVGTFRRELLKAGEGNPRWLRFFTLAGTLIAHQDGTPPASNVPTQRAAFDSELRLLRTELNVFERISSYNLGPQIKGSVTAVQEDAKYIVLTFELKRRSIRIQPFGPNELDQAIKAYEAAEKEHLSDSDYDTVMVSVADISMLEETFPNYFPDTTDFLRVVYADAWPLDEPGPAEQTF